ncbi:hypothetical protein ACFWN2_06325 [Lentzea sp. NPDC058436]|uniref:hypothetical protein n=1 Tax=Lentzea sp. NPDC058436 TaxID=3346499 RepID=UPI0036478462
MPLDVLRSAFAWLVTGPHPVSVDGRLFDGLPDRRLRLDDVRDLLLRRTCPQSVRDAVWIHLVRLARTEGSTWTVACAGIALPALINVASKLTARFADDPRDVHSAVLTGFLAELSTVDLNRPRVMVRLRWAAYRSGHAALREALDTPTPSASAIASASPAVPCGHPDLVLARAVEDGAISSTEAELIGLTRLEKVPLAEVAEQRGVSYEATKKARQRAERRLALYLRDDVSAVSPNTSGSGVQGCERRPIASAHTSSHEVPAASSSSTPGVPRCA